MRKIDGFLYDSLPPKIKNFIRSREEDWQNWTDEQVAAYIYTQLGLNYSFDPNYRYGDEAQKAQFEAEADNSKTFFNNLSRRFVVCSDLSSNILSFILNDIFYIRCTTVIDGSGPHRYNILQASGKLIKLDLQEDLANIQAQRRLEHFGNEDYYDGRSFSAYTNAEQDNLLASISYPGIPYTNNCLDSYAVVLRDNNVPLYERLELILLATGVKYEKALSQMGYCERVELLKKCITDYIPLSNGNKRKSYKADDEISHETVKRDGKFISYFSVKCPDRKRHYKNDGSSLKYEEVDELTYNSRFLGSNTTARPTGGIEIG